jgi:hypothetical protein
MSRPTTIAEFMEFFTDERVATLNKVNQNAIYWVGEEEEADALEIYNDVYDALPKPKKSQKVKTPEQIEADAKAEATAFCESVKSRKTQLLAKIPKDDDGKHKYVDVDDVPDSILRYLDDDEQHALTKSLKTIKKCVFTMEMNRLTATTKKSDGSFEKSRRCYNAESNNKESALTGETYKVEMGRKSEVSDYKVVSCDERKQIFGVKLTDDEKVIFNMSNKTTKQIKVKECLRNTPIDNIVVGGCMCAINYDFGNNVFKKGDDGVWRKQQKDWGCIPCNHKVVDGTRMCKRHTNGNKPITEWNRSMLKVSDDMIEGVKVDNGSNVSQLVERFETNVNQID